jgi:threonine/homoserine/homoserine lactone efflux protein
MLTFAIAALVLVMMPGPDQVLITRNALAGGLGGGLMTLVGGALGLSVHASAAALGLSALLLASSTAFTVLKIVGVAYLLWLGVQTLRAARKSRREPAEVGEVVAPQRRWASLRQGFLSNALNPKVALFFVTFLPQFLPTDSGSPRAEALMLSAVFALIYVSWFSAYVMLVERFGRWLRRPTVKARIEQVTGLALVTFAVRLASSNH